MPSESTIRPPYFDTPARGERLQLLLHLVRNAGEVIYLRAPTGAGKTRFTRRLLEILGSDTATVWVRGGLDSNIAAVAADQLGLAPEDVTDWPDGLFEATADQDLLFVVDDADQLELAAVERLAGLHAHGGRLLLLGRGGLAHTTRDWDVQFVDLPPFDAAETAAFLRSQAGAEAERIGDDLASALHRAAQGLPGPLLDALKDVVDRPAGKMGKRRPDAARPGMSGLSRWQWLAGGAAVVALTAVLLLEDQINALFEGGPASPPAIAEGDRLDLSDTDPASAPASVPLAVAPAGSSGVAEVPQQESSLGPASEDAQVGVDREAAAPAQAQEPAPRAESDGSGETASIQAAAVGGDTDPVRAANADATRNPPEPAPVASAPVAGLPGGVQDIDAEVDPDPLQAVMRDALAAARASSTAGLQSAPSGPAQSPVRPTRRESPTDALASPDAGVAEAGKEAETSALPEPNESASAQSGAAAIEGRTPAAAPAVTPSLVVETPAAQPAPVEEREVPAPVRAATPPPTTKPAPAGPAPVASTTAVRGGSDWLKSRPPRHYTLQLVGARDRAGVEKFVRAHSLSQPYAIFERQLDGRPWYSLVAGDYPDRGTAIAAKERLPRGLDRNDVWPRTFESIFKSQ